MSGVDRTIGGGRKSWIDIAKGILILLVVLGHVQYYAHDFAGTDDFKFVERTHIIFITWYMPAFFVITGYCTNFSIPFKEFLVKNVKSLIVPSVFLSWWVNLFLSPSGLSYLNFLQQDYYVILITCGPWFLTALFVAKMLMYGMQRYLKCNVAWKSILLLILMLVSASLYNKKVVTNVWYFEHALLLLPFMYFGILLRNHQSWKHEKLLFLMLGAANLALAVTMKWLHLPYPYIVGMVGVFWGNFWLCVLMGISGTLGLFVICERMNRCKWLEFLGRHTITIYLLQQSVMVFLIKMYLQYQIGLPRLFIAILLIFATTFICTLIDVFIDRYASVLKGKF